MSVIETRFSTKVEAGFSVVPTRYTSINRLRSGVEYRNANWSQSHRRYTGRYAAWTREMRDELLNVWEAAEGPTYGFLFKDWNDYRFTNQSLGTAPAGSTPVQLVRTYTHGARTHSRPITRPRTSTLTIYPNGIAKACTVDATTGLVTPTTAWTEGLALTVTGEFDVPVRFASDEIEFVLPHRDICEVNVELEELVGE